ncbi:MAG: adenylate/guanylate cyclase domain-containing protein [Acidiferrobacterales bacterium]
MGTEPLERKLAAILYADVAGYSRLTGEDEEGTHRRLRVYLDAITRSIEQYGGKVMHFAGDAVLADFPSVVDALICALAMQRDLAASNTKLPDERKLQFRIGINLGDVIVDRGEIYGDGVNVAARLETLAEPGGICISGTVFDALGSKLPAHFEYRGEQRVKNIDKPVRTYYARLQAGTVLPQPPPLKKSWLQDRRLVGVIATGLLLAIGIGALSWWAASPLGTERGAARMTPPPGMRRGVGMDGGIGPGMTRQQANQAAAREAPSAISLPAKPSVVVLPFDNLSDHPQGEFLADGVTDTVTATLGQVPGLFVISRNSAFTYKGKAVKVQEVSQELGVRYVLEGSVQRAGDRVRVTAQLVDATMDQHLWADRYDQELGDIFALQDEIALKVLIALQAELTEGEQANVRAHPTNNVEAYLLYVQAMVPFRTFTKNGMVEARRFAERSLTVDPGYSSALILGAWTHIIDARFGYSASRNESLRQANKLLEEAELAAAMPDSVRGEFLMARAFIDLMRHRHESATALGSKAVSLAPNNSFIIAVQGMILFFTRQYDGAVRLFERAMRLSPAYPGWYPLWLSPAYVFKGNHERAIVVAEEGIARAKSNFIRAANHVRAAFAYADQGNVEKAKQEVEHVKEITPVLTLPFYRAIMHFEHEEDWQRVASALRSAGLPE